MQNQKNEVKCRLCLKSKIKLRTTIKLKSRGFLYVDERGKRWAAGTCPSCKNKLDLWHKRKLGQRGVDGHSLGPIYQCRENEKIALKYLSTIGFNNLNLGSGKGPDIFGQYLGRDVTIEVKTVFKQRHNNGLFVNAVTKNRRNDDYMVYVYNKKCFLCTMQQHLVRTKKTGAVAVTKFFKPGGAVVKNLSSLILILLILFNIGCATAKPVGLEPLKNSPIGSNLEVKSQISPEEAALDAELAAAFTPDPLDEAFAAAEAVPAPYVGKLPAECDAAPTLTKRRCWHLFTTEPAYPKRVLGDACEFDFQCNDFGEKDKACRLGVDRDKPYETFCTRKLPEEI